MKYLENDVAGFYFDNDELSGSIERLCNLIKSNPKLLTPFRGNNETMASAFAMKGFSFYPTVLKTTLLYDRSTEFFIKVIHPLTLKNRIFSYVIDRSRAVYNLSKQLNQSGIKIQEVSAYGLFKEKRQSFFALKRVEGESLYDILIKDKKSIPAEVYKNVITEIMKLHRLGYWLSDAHLAHIFILDKEVTGIIDNDSIRKNRPFMLRNLVKDLAGLNHPGLPLSEDKKKPVLDYYMNTLNIVNRKKFLRLLRHYTDKRWN
jgi:hypothetical protein